jgi:hypothetical protein
MSARVAHFPKPAIIGPSAADLQRMIDDGRLIFSGVVEGRQVYKLDRKRLGMEECPEKKDEPLGPEYKEPVEQEPLEELKVKPVKMPKTLAAAMKRMEVKKFKR